MARNEAGLQQGDRARFRNCVPSSGRGSRCLGNGRTEPVLEYADRVADFLEFGELMCLDALHRNESCGGHFREEYQTAEGEAYATTNASAMSPPGNTRATTPVLHKERLTFDEVHPTRGVTGITRDAHFPAIWRQDGPAERGRIEHLSGAEICPGYVLPGDARCSQRGTHPARRGTGRLRP